MYTGAIYTCTATWLDLHVQLQPRSAEQQHAQKNKLFS